MKLYKKLKQIKQDIQNLFDDLKYIKNSSKSYDYNDYKDMQKEKIIIDSLLNCPVCGKKPKIYRDYNYEYMSYGAWCQIKCKHIIGINFDTQCGKSTWDRALLGAVESWNDMVINYRRNKDG